jgi:integrase
LPLELYKRRHSEECLAELARRAETGQIEYPEDLDHYRHCRCAWWVRGTSDHGKLIPRHSLKVYTWDAACAALQKLNQPDSPTGTRKLLTAAKEEWLAEKKLQGRTEPTLAAYDLSARTLIDFLAGQRVRYVQDVTPALLNRMRSTWEVATNTHNTYRTQISTFLNFCVRMEWLPSNPMKKTLPAGKPETAPDAEQEDGDNATMPLDEEGDANYRKACESIIPFLRNELPRPSQVRKRARRNVFLQHPENCLALCHLMYETGLRISDATFFDPAKIVVDEHGGIYTTRQIKNRRRGAKSTVTVFLDPWLVEEIQALPKLGDGRYPFYDGSKDWRRFINNHFRPVLRELGEVIGIPGSLRPHRFRDSFAVNRLNEGMNMDELRLLLGHASVAMTERYYAPFVKSRATSLRTRYHATKEAHRSGKIVSIATKAG